MNDSTDSSKWTGIESLTRHRDHVLWDEAQELLNDACAEGLGRNEFELSYPRAMNAVIDALAKYKPKPWLEDDY